MFYYIKLFIETLKKVSNKNILLKIELKLKIKHVKYFILIIIIKELTFQNKDF